MPRPQHILGHPTLQPGRGLASLFVKKIGMASPFCEKVWHGIPFRKKTLFLNTDTYVDRNPFWTKRLTDKKIVKLDQSHPGFSKTFGGQLGKFQNN